MTNKITDLDNLKGIRISVKSLYLNKTFFGKKIKYRFKNIITIYNVGKNTVQIISKHKKVFDLKGVKYISGLIKNKPILKPGSKLRLELNYSMRSKIASIIGYFSIICLNTSTKCKAYIPTIKLSPPETLN
ncbi:MAG: hypothetical protein CMC45_02405 [Flavobacteriaceae bacterium]|jgi:uncharacterized protein affecting Mg2+/Co2+ transport|nr:hypothetical protein [Flavobacteriaceae bacterium]|tara:strand:+ start:3045 stop:3437 length:393 start_codon:yes stop_codon:yes gene_type:complete